MKHQIRRYSSWPQSTRNTAGERQSAVVVSSDIRLRRFNTHSVNVRIRVLGLAMLGQNTWGDLVDLADQLEHGIIR